MAYDAFGYIQEGLLEELSKQGFTGPEDLETENARAVMFKTDEVAYSLQYNKRQQFELMSTTLDGSGAPTQWRSLSSWLYDRETGEKADAESILGDFMEIIRGPKRVALVQQKAKKGKNSDRVIDPLFFMNRLASLFPDVKKEIKKERILYGQIRFAVFTKNIVAPIIEDVALRYPDSEVMDKVCTLLSDMYSDGDLDLRSLISITILNNVSEEAYTAIKEKLSDALKLDTKYTRKLIGKNIKPEKPKKEKKVVARLDGK